MGIPGTTRPSGANVSGDSCWGIVKRLLWLLDGANDLRCMGWNFSGAASFHNLDRSSRALQKNIPRPLSLALERTAILK